MCLMALMLDPNPTHGGYRLVLAFNRDEAYNRPTKPSAFWESNPNIISGQDMFAGKEGGTWLGMTRSGRLAMVLNILQPDGIDPNAKSRGFLVSNFLQGSSDGKSYLLDVAKERNLYNGFNLITIELSTNGNVCANYFTNYAQEQTEPIRIKPGIHALSNHTIHTSWPKTDHVRAEFEQILQRAHCLAKDKLTDELLTLMARDVPLLSSVDISKEDVDIGQIKELLKELVFVKSNTYGTRTTTIILVDADGNVSFTERTLKDPIDAEHLVQLKETHTFTLT